MLFNRRRILWGSAVLLLALSVISPFVLRIDGYDHVYNLLWIDSFFKLLHAGVIIPRWLPQSFGGLGAPSFYFYPPLPFYLSTLLGTITGLRDSATLFHLVGALATVGSFLTFQLFLSTFDIPKKSRWLPSLIFAIAPYRFFDLYVRNGFGEHLGIVFVPLLFYFMRRMFRSDRSLRDVVLFGTCWALIILSNIPLALVAAFGCLALVAADWIEHRKSANLFLLLGSGLFGCALAAYYLIPIVVLKPFAQIDNVLRLGGIAADPAYALVYLFTGANYTLTAVCLIDLVIAIAVIVQYRRDRAEQSNSDQAQWRSTFYRAFVFIAFGFVILNIPYLTLPLWRHFLPLQLIQFTFRFDILILFFGCALLSLPRAKSKRSVMDSAAILWCVAGIALVAMNVLGLRPHGPKPTYTHYDPAEYAPIYTSTDVQQVIRFADQHEHDRYAVPLSSLSADESVHGTPSPEAGGVIDCSLDSSRTIVAHSFYWPYWQCLVDGNNIHCYPANDGRLLVDLPRGKYRAVITMKRSEAEIVGSWISIVALSMGLLGFVFPFRFWKQENSSVDKA